MNSEIPPKIAEPCPKLWKEMKGDDKQRFCDHCNLHVHNLSEMTASERKNLLASQGRICVAYETDENGALLTRESIPWFLALFARLRWGFVTMLASIVSFGLSSCGVRQTLGAVGKPPPPSKSPNDRSTTSGESSDEHRNPTRGRIASSSKPTSDETKKDNSPTKYPAYTLGKIAPPSNPKSEQAKMTVGVMEIPPPGAADALKDISQRHICFMQAGAKLYTPGVNPDDKRFADIPREKLPNGMNPNAAESIKYAGDYNAIMVSHIISSQR